MVIQSQLIELNASHCHQEMLPIENFEENKLNLNNNMQKLNEKCVFEISDLKLPCMNRLRHRMHEQLEFLMYHRLEHQHVGCS